MLARPATFRQATDALARGDLAAAAACCTALLQRNPRDFEARHLMGRCLAARGDWHAAAEAFGQARMVHPRFYPALLDLALAHSRLGQHARGMAILEEARAIDDTPAELHLRIGLCAMGLGELTAAREAFERAIGRNPRLADAYNNLGVLADQCGNLQEAAEHFRQAVAARPNFLLALLNLSDVLRRSGNPSGSAAALESAVALQPHDAAIHASLGAARLAAGDFSGALGALEQATSLDARRADALANLGEALRHLGRFDEARTAFLRALSVDSELPEVHLGLGRTAIMTGDFAEARERLRRTAEWGMTDPGIALVVAAALEELGDCAFGVEALSELAARHPALAELREQLALALQRLGRLVEALESYERALVLEPARFTSLLGRGTVLESLGRHVEALHSIQGALLRRPDDSEALAALASCAARTCDWNLADGAIERLRSTPFGMDHLHPFLLLSMPCSAADQATSLRRRGERLAGAAAPSQIKRARKFPLKVAYLSPDFREHPVSHALVGMIEHHDRTRISPIAISLASSSARVTSDGPNDAPRPAIERRLRSAFDDFLEVSTMADRDIARALREREIDIAIDLAGHTLGSRPLIFAHRAAPVQIAFLGFPASTGCPFIDYLVADATVAPAVDSAMFSERVLRMPHCYLPFDDSRPEPCAGPSRSDVGLPEDATVLCAFNNGYKISRPMFETWMRILHALPRGVLWLRDIGSAALDRLSFAAKAAGVDPARLIVAPHVKSLDAHLCRLRLADLFLDTAPYNAHTSAAEALWAAVPVVTCPGTTFAARVGSSVLRAVGLPELITPDLDRYANLVTELALTPDALRHMNIRLHAARRHAPLFDTTRFTRAFEELLVSIP